MNSVAIATCRALPDGDEDADALRRELGSRGVSAEWCVWDDPAVDWREFDLTVVRSTWDYTGDRDRFLTWAAGLERLANPAPVLAWNTDKSYLSELAQAGIAIVPTQWLEPGAPIEPAARQFVIKPAVGAGARGAARFDAEVPGALTAAAEHAQALHDAGRRVLMQPYLEQVDTDGETALIFIAGRFSHAIAKKALLEPDAIHELGSGYSRSLFVPERISARVPAAAELALAARVLDVVTDRFGPLLYARVDLLPSADGPVVIELELTEPSLFLSYSADAPPRLAQAITDLVRATPPSTPTAPRG